MGTKTAVEQLEGLAVDNVDITLYGISKGCIKCDMTNKRLNALGFDVNKIDVDLASEEEYKTFPKMQGISAPLVVVSVPGTEKAYHWNDMRTAPLDAFRDEPSTQGLVDAFDAMVADNRGVKAGEPERQ